MKHRSTVKAVCMFLAVTLVFTAPAYAARSAHWTDGRNRFYSVVSDTADFAVGIRTPTDSFQVGPFPIEYYATFVQALAEAPRALEMDTLPENGRAARFGTKNGERFVTVYAVRTPNRPDVLRIAVSALVATPERSTVRYRNGRRVPDNLREFGSNLAVSIASDALDGTSIDLGRSVKDAALGGTGTAQVETVPSKTVTHSLTLDVPAWLWPKLMEKFKASLEP